MVGDIVILRDRTGKRRTHIYVNCDHCGKLFPKVKRFLRDGKRNFCNKSCQSSFTKNRIITKCAVCSKIVERRNRSTKSGLVFCCQDHKNIAQSYKCGRLLKCGVDNQGVGYRVRALATYGEKCEWCSRLFKEHTDNMEDNYERK